MKDKKNIQLFSGMLIKDKKIVNPCMFEGVPSLIVFDGNKQTIIKGNQVKLSDTVYQLNIPTINKSLIAPTNIGRRKDTEELLKEVISALKRVVVLPNECDYVIMALFIMSTYVYRIFPYCLYIQSTGHAGCGKSIKLNAVSRLSYMSIRVSGKSTDAALVRSMDQIHGSLFIDEVQAFAGDKTSTSHVILATGFSAENGFTHKVETIDKQHHVREYDIYGPKFLSGRSAIPDMAILSRSYECKMTPKKRSELPTEKPSHRLWQEDAESIRNDLMFWAQRAIYHHEIKKKKPFKVDADKIDSMVQLTPRDYQIYEILFSICPDDITLKLVIEGIKRQKNTVNSFRQEQREPLVLITLLRQKVSNQSVPIQDIAYEVSQHTGRKHSPRSIGFILNDNNLSKKRTNKGVVCDASRKEIESAIERLGIKLDSLSTQSSPSEESDDHEDNFEDSTYHQKYNTFIPLEEEGENE